MPVFSDRSPKILPDGPPDIAATRLIAANINPVTGLATDYLNHFNEAIMLLEMLTTMPECVGDLLAWRSRSYQEHFADSCFRDRALAIAAYGAVNSAARQHLDELACRMNGILIAARDAFRNELSPAAAERLAQQAVGWLRPLVARAGAVINGHFEIAVDGAHDHVPQRTVDALFEQQSP